MTNPTFTPHTLARSLTAAGFPSHVVSGGGGRWYVEADPPGDPEPWPEPEPPEWRACPTCQEQGVITLMERHGRSWVCPVARTEARGVSDELRASIRAAAEQRVDFAPF